MIASHNTFSYLRSAWYNELFSIFWRCQNHSADRQVIYDDVDVCDIRVCFHDGRYQMCHGRVRFGEHFDTLQELVIFAMSFGFSRYRILGRDVAYSRFIVDYNAMPENIKDMCLCCIYQPTWTYVYDSGIKITEHNKHMWYQGWPLWKNIKNFLWPTIKRYAKKNNASADNPVDMYDYVQYVK